MIANQSELVTSEIERIFAGFSKLRALVIGDVMIDAYYWGKVDRISPEAPVPVVAVTHTEHRLGGAANVALNILSLGAKPIICAVTGDDEKGKLFDQLLDERKFDKGAMVKLPRRMTTVKTRVISGGHHLLRVDEETTSLLSTEEEALFLATCLPWIDRNKIDVVILEDYNKGVLTPAVIRAVIAKAKTAGIPVTVDPKKDHFFDYIGVDLFKPNFKELVEGLKIDVSKKDQAGIAAAIKALKSRLQNTLTMVTLSEQGVVIDQDGAPQFIAAHPREILDVSGAGDTVISVASLALALQANAATIAILSNLAGGLVCEKVGVVPIELDRLKAEALKIAR